MLCWKFNLKKITLVLILTCLNVAYADKRFTSHECFKADFNFDVEKKAQYFGLLQSKFGGSKSKCILQLKVKSIMETVWDIDICRSPIHLKKTEKGSQDVYKKLSACAGSEKKEFCAEQRELFTIIQDEGLIFAQGERELLTTHHGKLFCFNLLLKKYLNENVLFSNYDEVPNIYGGTTTSRKESVVIKQKKMILPKKQTAPEVEIESSPVIKKIDEIKENVEAEVKEEASTKNIF